MAATFGWPYGRYLGYCTERAHLYRIPGNTREVAASHYTWSPDNAGSATGAGIPCGETRTGRFVEFGYYPAFGCGGARRLGCNGARRVPS